MKSNRSSGNSSMGLTCWIPALLTRMSTAVGSPARPSRSARSATTGLIPDSWATSASPGLVPVDGVHLGARPAQGPAMAAPMPLAAPVTSAVLPFRSIGSLAVEGSVPRRGAVASGASRASLRASGMREDYEPVPHAIMCVPDTNRRKRCGPPPHRVRP